MNRSIASVIIGRNEGERLRNCIKSVQKSIDIAVYVDSGSTDNSVEFAAGQGVDVVKLDMSIPFSAARARNGGFDFLYSKYPDIEYVQFIDGDCELDEEWISRSVQFLEENRDYAIAAGRRKEKFPEASIYNRMCDFEWNTPVGEADASGGDFLIRSKAFSDVGGFNPEVVAGEEPEMCYRLRAENWRIYRMDAPMTYHDAAIFHFGQWWRRSKRTGHAYLQGCLLHLSDKKRYYLKESLKDWIWSFILPLILIAGSLLFSPSVLILFAVYPARLLRVFFSLSSQITDERQRLVYSFFLILSNFPQLTGQFLFLKRTLSGGKIKIIEYDNQA